MFAWICLKLFDFIGIKTAGLVYDCAYALQEEKHKAEESCPKETVQHSREVVCVEIPCCVAALP